MPDPSIPQAVNGLSLTYRSIAFACLGDSCRADADWEQMNTSLFSPPPCSDRSMELSMHCLLVCACLIPFLTRLSVDEAPFQGCLRLKSGFSLFCGGDETIRRKHRLGQMIGGGGEFS